MLLHFSFGEASVFNIFHSFQAMESNVLSKRREIIVIERLSKNNVVQIFSLSLFPCEAG